MPLIEECPHDIIYVNDEEPGFTRNRQNGHFIYFDDKGQKVKNENLISRFDELTIPPVWEDVWICKLPKGHLQATGYDAKMRKQYIYHPEWIAFRQKYKYHKLAEFGRLLPLIRKQIEVDIHLQGWPKPKVLALVVMLMDEHYIRIGNRYYEKENHTYGLTTLRRKHLEEKEGKLLLNYKAKSGKYRNVKIESPTLVNLIKKSSELPGYEIFRYMDGSKSTPVSSHDVNEYLSEKTGKYFTAKDFRTWGGTVLAVEYFDAAKKEMEENPRKKLETALVRKVAKTLGNTVSTCREYYIHPKVLTTLINDDLDKYQSQSMRFKGGSELSKNEKLVLKIISE